MSENGSGQESITDRKMQGLPRISILTVVYNNAEHLPRAIESVLGQTLPVYEYLVIDGASTDGSADIARSYADRFEQKGIRYRVISEPDRGMYDALNKGAVLAGGDLIGQINSDDWYEPGAAVSMAEAYRREPFDMAFADLRMIRPDGTSWIKKARVDRFVNSRHWNHPTQFTRRQLLLEHPYPSECMSDDLDLMLWLRSSGCRVRTVPGVLANFTTGGMSHSRKWNDVIDRIRTKSCIYHRYGYGWLHDMDTMIVETGKYLLEMRGEKR